MASSSGRQTDRVRAAHAGREREAAVTGAVLDLLAGAVLHRETERGFLRPAEHLHREVAPGVALRDGDAGLCHRSVEHVCAVLWRLLPSFDHRLREGASRLEAGRAVLV